MAGVLALVGMLDDMRPPVVRKNKSRTDGMLWEVVSVSPDYLPISEENMKILGAFAGSDAAHNEASRIYEQDRARALQQYGDDRAAAAREAAIEEAALVCDGRSAWAEVQITDDDTRPYAAYSVGCDRCAEMIRALAAKRSAPNG